MGAVDVVPFIPIRNSSMDECIALSKDFGAKVAELYNIPVFLYEKSASAPNRENLANIRKGEFEGMVSRLQYLSIISESHWLNLETFRNVVWRSLFLASAIFLNVLSSIPDLTLVL